VQHHVAVPAETVQCVARPLRHPPAEGVVAERHNLAVGSPYLRQHAVGVPTVAGVARLPVHERVSRRVVSSRLPPVVLTGVVGAEQQPKPARLLLSYGIARLTVFRSPRIDVPAALMHEVPLAVVGVVVLAVPQQPAPTVVPASFALGFPVQVAHLVGRAEDALVERVVAAYEVAQRVAYIGMIRRATIIRAHADKSKGGEHDCKYQSYHLHGLLLSILQN